MNTTSPQNSEKDVSSETAPGTDWLISVAEVARRAGVSIPTIYSMIRDGKLRARKLGKCTRIAESDFQAMIAALPLAGQK